MLPSAPTEPRRSTPKGALLIDHSTNPSRADRALSHRAKSLGLHWVDAPVSGGILKRETAISRHGLTHLRPEDADRARPFIQGLCQTHQLYGLVRQRPGREIVQSGHRRQHDRDLVRRCSLTRSPTNSTGAALIDTLERRDVTRECGGHLRNGLANGTFPDPLGTRT